MSAIMRGLRAAAKKQAEDDRKKKEEAERKAAEQDSGFDAGAMFDTCPADVRDRIMALPQHFRDGTTNPEWLMARRHVMTGSKVAGLTGNGYSTPDQLLKHMLWPSTHSVNEIFTSYGNRNESTCEHQLRLYLRGRVQDPGDPLVRFEIRHPGLVKDLGCMGYSPDGHVVESYADGSSAVVLSEYKCPFSKRRFNPGPEHRGRLDVYGAGQEGPDLYGPITLPLLSGGSSSATTKRRLPITAYYYDQVQWGMGLGLRQGLLRTGPCCPSMKCYFVVWTPAYSQLCEVPYDQAYADHLRKLAAAFMRDRYAPCVELKLGGHLRYGCTQPPSPQSSPPPPRSASAPSGKQLPPNPLAEQKRFPTPAPFNPDPSTTTASAAIVGHGSGGGRGERDQKHRGKP